MLKSLALFTLTIFLYSCSGDLNKNRSKIDEVYGACDNPNRPLTTRQYKLCKAKEMGNGESLFNLTDDFNKLMSGNSNTIIQYNVNPDLWKAALDITKKYSLKIADNQGGIIETDWINDVSNNTRCLIKIRITSQELVSNGVEVNFVCERQSNQVWISDEQDYVDEENQMVLKILKTANALNQSKL